MSHGSALSLRLCTCSSFLHRTLFPPYSLPSANSSATLVVDSFFTVSGITADNTFFRRPPLVWFEAGLRSLLPAASVPFYSSLPVYLLHSQWNSRREVGSICSFVLHPSTWQSTLLEMWVNYESIEKNDS